jgi:hypothetical protein
MAVAAGQRRAGVEADIRFARDQWIVEEARISFCILHHHQLAGLQHGVGAKRVASRRLRYLKAQLGFEPLAILVNKGNGPHRCSTNAGEDV